MMEKTVIKIGGSLIEEAPQLMKHIADKRKLFEKKILIIPGGGMFANFIREADDKLKLSSDSSHWMAILAMEQYGYYLAEKADVPVVASLENNNHPLSIFLPYSFLKEHDPLPHSWDVTSDTIAAFFAAQTNADFVKVTDVDGILVDQKLVDEIYAKKLSSMEKTCVDISFPDYLNEKRMDCFVTNGKYPDRLLDYLQGKKTVGTLIKGNI
ncbi:amino acid kinase [Methanohalophilus sp.]|uniref:amino acid kinase family protein n=1 Tax=Methanohalophilus sp. TaxID=1966352 RepID=UPI002621C62F|nr:amino acid kinase [Methanohalophilus sp.]MDK2892253.1 5-(aminomethyl)-3-furanmethanol phosphate kinase [Methanohalophilus sp.]